MDRIKRKCDTMAQEEKKFYAKICLFCHKPFGSTDKRKKYCCSDCGIKDRNRKRDALKKLNTENRSSITRECPICHKTFTTTDTKKMYCGIVCQRKAGYQKKRARNGSGDAWERKLIRCANPRCGKYFLPQNRNHRYCSPECRSEHEYLLSIESDDDILICQNVLCRKKFKPDHPGQRYCSQECAAADGEAPNTDKHWTTLMASNERTRKFRQKQLKKKRLAEEKGMKQWAYVLNLDYGQNYGIIRHYYTNNDFNGLQKRAPMLIKAKKREE